jgi:hypothetical protein
MLVARMSFTDPTDGQPIVAGCTYVAEDSEVAIMFPQRFRAAQSRSGGSGIIRAGGTAGITAGSDQRSATPLPKLYEELELNCRDCGQAFTSNLRGPRQERCPDCYSEWRSVRRHAERRGRLAEKRAAEHSCWVADLRARLREQAKRRKQQQKLA